MCGTLYTVHLERDGTDRDVGDIMNRVYVSNCITVPPPITLIKKNKNNSMHHCTLYHSYTLRVILFQSLHIRVLLPTKEGIHFLDV